LTSLFYTARVELTTSVCRVGCTRVPGYLISFHEELYSLPSSYSCIFSPLFWNQDFAFSDIHVQSNLIAFILRFYATAAWDGRNGWMNTNVRVIQ